MSGYIWILIWIGFVAMFTKSVNVEKTEEVLGVKVKRCYWLFAFFAFLPVIIMAGSRSFLIGDTLAYKTSFSFMPNSFNDLGEYMAKNSKDFGFYFLSSLFKIMISDNPRDYFWTISIVQGLLLLSFFRKYSSSYVVSLFLFVVSGEYISWMYNGIRQFIAVTIILLATKYIARKKYVRAIIIILLAATIHQSALIMIPIVFFVQGEAWNKRTVIFALIIMASVMFINQFTNVLDDSLAGTQYQSVVSQFKETKNAGTSIPRVLVFSVPAIMSLIYRDKINEKGDSFIKLCVNMSVISSGIYIVSMFTSGIFVGRLPIYCSLFNYLLLPWMLDEIFDISIRTIVYTVMVTLYLIFYWFQMGVVWQLL